MWTSFAFTCTVYCICKIYWNYILWASWLSISFFFALSHRKHVCSCSEAVYGDARREEKFMKTPRIDGSSLYIYIFIKAPPRGDVSLLSRCETCRLRRYSISITHLVALFNGHESPCVPKQNLNTRHVMLLA